MNHLDLSDGKVKNTRAIIWREEGAARRFLLTQEFSGTFTVPGGAKDLEDIDLATAIERELREELGLEPEQYRATRIDWSKEYENLYRDKASERHGKKTVVYLFLVFMEGDPVLSPRAGEIEDAIWVDEEEALRLLSPVPHMKEIFEVGLRSINVRNKGIV